MSDATSPARTGGLTPDLYPALCQDIAAAVGRGETGVDLLMLAVRAEREACAQYADIEHEDPGDDIDIVLTRLAAAIRARRP